MLPEKAVQKIKFVKKADLSQYVEPDQALKCWGGNDNYTFVFVSEVEELESPISSNSITISNKKVMLSCSSTTFLYFKFKNEIIKNNFLQILIKFCKNEYRTQHFFQTMIGLKMLRYFYR